MALQIEVASVSTACVPPTLHKKSNHKGGSMALTCQVIHCENTDLVYSGTDAFQLGGIPTERYCRPCAIAYVFITREMNPAND
jgi:hypothetical protein